MLNSVASDRIQITFRLTQVLLTAAVSVSRDLVSDDE